MQRDGLTTHYRCARMRSVCERGLLLRKQPRPDRSASFRAFDASIARRQGVRGYAARHLLAAVSAAGRLCTGRHTESQANEAGLLMLMRCPSHPGPSPPPHNVNDVDGRRAERG